MAKKKPHKTVKDGRGRARDYRAEYDEYHSSPEAKKQRAARNAARRKSGLAKGDPREVDHKKPLGKGGGNAKSNTRIVSRKVNRAKGNKGDRKR